MVVSQAVDSLRKALLLAHPALRIWKQQIGRSSGGSHSLILFLYHACVLVGNGNGMFWFHFALQVPQIERATGILRQAIQRQLQEFTDPHSAFLKNEDHLHPWSLQTAEI